MENLAIRYVNAVPRDVGNIRRAFVTFGDLEFSDNVENYKSYNAKISRRLGVGGYEYVRWESY